MKQKKAVDQTPHSEFLLQAEDIFKEAREDGDPYMAGLVLGNIAQGFADMDETGGGIFRLGQIFHAYLDENPGAEAKVEVFEWFAENKKFTKSHEITDIWVKEE